MKNTMLTPLTLLAVCFAIVVIVFGAFTRLVDAGLGCPDWPTCYGHLWVPNEASEIATANSQFAETPVETDKTWPEQIHRIFASSLGLIVFAMFILALRSSNVKAPGSILLLFGLLFVGTVARIFVGESLDIYLLAIVFIYFANLVRCFLLGGNSVEPKPNIPIKLPAFVAGMVILQGLFGMWTVTLKLWPQVVTAHLLGGFATLSLLWLLVNRFAGWAWSLPADKVVELLQLRRLSLIALIVVVVQVGLGGWTSSNYSALACPDFPLCQGQILPEADFVRGFNFFQSLGPNYLGGLLDGDARVAIHLSHRLGALIVAIVVGILGIKLIQNAVSQVRLLGALLVSVLVVQISLGISNVIFFLPLWVAVLHNAGGALLIMILVTINHRVHTIKTI